MPTTLSGAPMTRFHRMPAGVDAVHARAARAGRRRAGADGVAADARPGRERDERARARGRVALRADAQPGDLDGRAARGRAVRVRARRGASRGATTSRSPRSSRGYAVGCAGFAVHHAVCQTTVRVLGTPHAQTNAVMLPHSAAFVARARPGSPSGRRARAHSRGSQPARG